MLSQGSVPWGAVFKKQTPKVYVMYAVIKTGGKQYRVATGDIIKVEKIPGAAGDSVVFDRIIAVGGNGNIEVGSPLVAGANVAGTVLDQARARKVIVFKKKRRKNYRRKNGHRQYFTAVEIGKINTAAEDTGKSETKTEASGKKAAKASAGKKSADTPKGKSKDTGTAQKKSDK
jgi:large subunit ribosomal protein L21